jgi:four helix bundle protein
VVYLGRARGSNFEIETQVAIAAMLGFGAQSSREKVEKLCREVGKMLGAMIRELRR